MSRLATDVGGTFTDLVRFDEATGALTVAKALTTPADPSQGVMDAIRLAKVDLGAVGFFIHGGTTVINAITERKGARTALVTTHGFRDVLEIGRGNRPDLYNLQFQSPTAFVPRHLRFEVTERVSAKGEIVTPLRLDELDAIADHCRHAGVEAVAIVFLHSYLRPEHEARCRDRLRERLPGVKITASHDITREWREYERSNTAVLNAYVQPIIERYFDRLDQELATGGLACGRYAMQSNGGSASFASARNHP
ncbi:MAG: hydantoinase/oxoprolinase family protein, partial [Kiloniellales bacterium]|nr:hydantoinase/oxoprolinase family protein [Kiloniellales bacterium]